MDALNVMNGRHYLPQNLSPMNYYQTINEHKRNELDTVQGAAIAHRPDIYLLMPNAEANGPSF